jgi:SAM-dependent methyltransferase
MLKILKMIVPKGVRKGALLFFHRGNRYKCSFCGYESRDLGSIGSNIKVIKEKQIVGAGKRNCKCFNCGSIDRERLIHVYLKNKLQIFDKNKVRKILHFSPEKRLTKTLIEHGFEEYICGDLFAEGYDYPEYVKNINILDIPYENNYFDLIICNHVLEHIIDDSVAMKELFRVIKKSGKAILQVPISRNSENSLEDFSITEPKQREVIFGQYDHVRIYGQDYVHRLEKSGFIVQRVNISNEFSNYGLNQFEDLFICEKE